MKYAFSIFYTFVFFTFTTAQNTENYSIHFDFDSYELSAEAEQSLKEIQNNLEQSFQYTLEIIGHTDQDGDFEYNNNLAAQRAQQVFNFYIENGMNQKQISYLSKGEYDLLFNQNDNISKSKNRRVEIIAKMYEIESVDEMMALLSPESSEQEFLVPISREQKIEGKEGTIVEIPENAFVFEDGSSPKGPVIVSLTEAFDYNAFMNHDLSCRSNDRLLESGGMIKLTARSEGRTLKMKEGKEIALTFPESELKEGMELFYGEVEAEGVANWEATGEPIGKAKVEIDDEILAIIDLKSLLVNLETPKKPVFDVPSFPLKPITPQKPHKPYKPIEPLKENINVNFSLKQKLFLSKKEKDEILESKFQKKYEKYLIDLEKYESKLSRFYELSEAFSDKKIKSKIAIKEWEDKMEELRFQVGHYYLKLEVYRNEKMIFDAQKYLQKNVNEEDKYRVLHNYSELLNRKDLAYDLSIARTYKRKLFTSKDYFIENYKRNTIRRNGSVKIIDEALEVRIDRTNKIFKGPESMLAEATFKLNKNKSIQDLGKYATSISSLGWINCDRFKNVDETDKRELALKADKDTKFYLAFQDINSMLTPFRIDNEISFSGIPTGERVTLVGIQLKENKPYIFYKEMQIVGNEKLIPSFQETTFDELSAVFASL